MACQPDSKSIAELIADHAETSKKPTIVTYVGTREKALGQCKLSVVRKGVKHRITFNVLQGK